MAQKPLLPTMRQRGLSLVELMVGLVIGLVAVLVVMQVFQLAEGSRRTTVGGDDAQIAGALSIASLQREVRQAGYGTSAFPLAGCSIRLPAGWTLPVLAPLVINPQSAPGTPLIPGADANTDTLLVAFGSTRGSPEGDLVSAQGAQNVYSVATPTSFEVDDLVVAAVTPRAAPCSLVIERVTAVTRPSPPEVTVGTGVAGMVNGTLYNFGSVLRERPQFLAYRVRNGGLSVCDYWVNDCSSNADVDNEAFWVPIANGIVSLRAQYGVDTSPAGAMDAAVDEYSQATPDTQCGWARVSAMRLAVVARSGELEREPVAASAPEWAGQAGAPIDLSGLPNGDRYRYKTFETTVPVRNMAWQGVQTGC